MNKYRDIFFLNEDIWEMFHVSDTILTSYYGTGGISSERQRIVREILRRFFKSNVNSAAISVEGLYEITKAMCRENGNRFLLYRLQFSNCLAFFLLSNTSSKYELKKFKDNGWVILDVKGRTLENSYMTIETDN